MAANSYTLHGLHILEYASGAPCLHDLKEAVDAIGTAISQSASLLVVPMENLDPQFFNLRTGMAGEIIQKFVTYRLRLAIVGDFSELTEESAPLRDFIYEANQGESVWFVSTIEELHAQISREWDILNDGYVAWFQQFVNYTDSAYRAASFLGAKRR